jgi:hypothetical protein
MATWNRGGASVERLGGFNKAEGNTLVAHGHLSYYGVKAK